MKRNIKFLLLFSSALIILDQLTKYIFTNKIINLVIFSINYIENKGIIFGLFQEEGMKIILATFVLILLLILMTIQEKKYFYSFVFLLSGTLSNLIDRMLLGYVRDFIDFKIWPVFNLADSFIVVGVFLLIYLMIKEKGFKKIIKLNVFT